MPLVALVQAPSGQHQEFVVGSLEHVGSLRVLVTVEQQIHAVRQPAARDRGVREIRKAVVHEREPQPRQRGAGFRRGQARDLMLGQPQLASVVLVAREP